MKHTSWVGGTPENNGAVLVFLRTKDVVEVNSKSVEVANVQRAKVMVEGIVEESVIDGEVARRLSGAGRWCGGRLPTLPGRGRCLGVWERCLRGGRVNVSGQVQAVWHIGQQ